MSKEYRFRYQNDDGGVTVAITDAGFRIDAPQCSLESRLPTIGLEPAGAGGEEVTLAAAGTSVVPVRDREFEFIWAAEGVECRWRIRLDRYCPIVRVGAEIRNRTLAPVRVKRIGLLNGMPTGARCAGDPSQWLLNTQGDRYCRGNLAERLPSLNEFLINLWKGFGQPVPNALATDVFSTDGDWRSFYDYATLYCDHGAKGMSFAATGTPQATVHFRFHTGRGGEAGVLADSFMSGIELLPGQAREAQEIAVLAMPYADAMPEIARELAAACGARVHRKPIVGWCSWYNKGADVTADDVLRVAEKAAQERDTIPLDFIQIDDGFQKTAGDWSCNGKFPDGWAPVIEKIRAAGAQPGIWLAPLAVHEKTDLFREHPDWFQRRADGGLAGMATNWGATSYWLDPTHPGAQQYLRELLIGFKRQGFTYFKLDFNVLEETTRFHDSSLTLLQVFRQLYALYREAIGEDSYLLACSGFTRGVFGYADSVRVGPDSSPDWRAPHSCCISECLKCVGSSAYANRVVATGDPDVTYLGTFGTLTEAEWRTWHSFVGIYGGAVLISDYLFESPAAERLRSLEILTPPAPEHGVPFDGGCDYEERLLGFACRRSWGNAVVCNVYNPSGAARDLAVDLALCGCETGTSSLVWSFWDERISVVEGNSLTVAELPSHDCRLLRITPLGPEPCFVGSTLHISCGAAELADFRVTEREISLVLSDAGAREGALFVRCDGTLVIGSAEGLRPTALNEVEPGIWRIAVAGRERGGAQRITLNRVKG